MDSDADCNHRDLVLGSRPPGQRPSQAPPPEWTRIQNVAKVSGDEGVGLVCTGLRIKKKNAS